MEVTTQCSLSCSGSDTCIYGVVVIVVVVVVVVVVFSAAIVTADVATTVAGIAVTLT